MEAHLKVRGPVVGDRPDIRAIPLPNGARLAFTVQVALEASYQLRGTSMPEDARGRGLRDYAAESAQLYGPRTGIGRLAQTIEAHDMRACVHVSGLVVERWPELVAGLAEKGHELVGHAYSQDEQMALMDETEDLATVRKCSEVIERVSGERPVGWSSQASRRGEFTVLSLLKEGYTYTRDFRDADIPYVVAQLGDRRLLAMTRTDEINDLPISRANHPPSVFVEYFKRAFDQLYMEGVEGPRLMTCVTHATVSGKPWGASAVAECLSYVRQFEAVWCATGREVAEYYLEHLPPLEDSVHV
jgi:peptidoglycan/xylan/chitin deacetylase (PgdA/CDA1 family)